MTNFGCKWIECHVLKPATEHVSGWAVAMVILCLFCNAPAQTKIETHYNAAKDETVVRLLPIQLLVSHRLYHSIQISPSFGYPGKTAERPEYIDFEIQTVVKARRLRPDLYVLFLIDDEQIFLSSNRSAVKNPVRGRTWVGERLLFRMPLKTFLRMAYARTAAIKMDGDKFELTQEQLEALKEFDGAIPKNDPRTKTN